MKGDDSQSFSRDRIGIHAKQKMAIKETIAMRISKNKIK